MPVNSSSPEPSARVWVRMHTHLRAASGLLVEAPDLGAQHFANARHPLEIEGLAAVHATRWSGRNDRQHCIDDDHASMPPGMTSGSSSCG